jgi:hypothetical protein
MKNFIVFGLVVLFSLFFLGCAHVPENTGGTSKSQETPKAQTSGAQQEVAVGQTTGPPVVEIPETLFDFGRVSEGNDYVHAFKIVNTGTGVLEIRKILPG